MQTYVLTLACETCEAQMSHRVGDLTADPGDELVIDVAMAVSQVTFECGSCGGVTYTGDFEDFSEHEAGVDPADDGEPEDPDTLADDRSAL